MTYLLRILTLLFSKLSIDVIIVRQLLVKIYIKFGSGFCPINTTAHEVRQSEPPHLNWSSAMFRKRRTDNDEQTTEAGRDYHEVEAS